jgi:OmpA-OmpF porin, OOP family
LFDFDKAVLKPEGRRKLDELADALRGKHYDSIVANGYTDRAGSVSYNLALSQRRANAVKQYLLGKGLEVDKITAVGKGKSEQLVKPTDCKTPGMTRAAILACLQPDRRVVIEVAGGRVLTAPAKSAAPEAKPAAAPARPLAPKAKPAAKGKTIIGQ